VEAAPFRVASGDLVLRGEEVGEGPPILLAHGLTATRRYVVHGSNALPRRGYRLVSYDARGHGESDPGPAGSYGYSELAADLAAVVGERVGGAPAVLAGHSMGAHTIVRFALANPEGIAGLVLIGPAAIGGTPDPDSLAGWDRLADALESGGIEGFVRANDNPRLDPRWRETTARITRERLGRHRDLDAVGQALREVPRSVPFDGLDELEQLELPALVVASHDDVDPGHPYSVAAAWAEHLRHARLVSEQPGQSPLAWQGGRLSRVIADFLDERGASSRAPYPSR
jgi:pimeloyl-ACP methyl ester carboxylesterase